VPLRQRTSSKPRKKHATEALKASGQALQDAVRETVGGAQASVQKIRETVSAARSAESEKKH